MSAFSFGVVLTCAYVRWDLRRTIFLWILLSAVTALNVLAIYSLVPTRFVAPAVSVAPIFILETLVVLGLIWFIERIKGR